MRAVQVHVSYGEAADKISILEIKSAKLTDPAKLANVAKELALLRTAFAPSDPGFAPLFEELKKINEELWQIEDDIRECEKRGDFGPEFIRLARAVYITNDRRAKAKRGIDDLLGSELKEEKSY